ncbi:hypothetical protein SK128_020791 [Halocaridina rubra]|uniref:Uncharacterized protein n=1 Tax=Halocaridina rubra TaxID=373956 RepID=A0AAN8XHN1_HALRR
MASEKNGSRNLLLPIILAEGWLKRENAEKLCCIVDYQVLYIWSWTESLTCSLAAYMTVKCQVRCNAQIFIVQVYQSSMHDSQMSGALQRSDLHSSSVPEQHA